MEKKVTFREKKWFFENDFRKKSIKSPFFWKKVISEKKVIFFDFSSIFLEMFTKSQKYPLFFWKNEFHFLRLRADAHAQYEIRVYADAICDLVRDWVPAAYGAFEDYRLGGAVLSAKSLDCVRRLLAGETVTQENSGMSKGEWREFDSMIKP